MLTYVVMPCPPPRRRGVAAAHELAGAAGADSAAVLVLQVDADTIYKPGYVAATGVPRSRDPAAIQPDGGEPIAGQTALTAAAGVRQHQLSGVIRPIELVGLSPQPCRNSHAG